MSSGGIFDALRPIDLPDRYGTTAAYIEALDDVREALRNPTDEQVESLADAVREVVYHDGDYFPDLIVRAVLTALAGGSDV